MYLFISFIANVNSLLSVIAFERGRRRGRLVEIRDDPHTVSANWERDKRFAFASNTDSIAFTIPYPRNNANRKKLLSPTVLSNSYDDEQNLDGKRRKR